MENNDLTQRNCHCHHTHPIAHSTQPQQMPQLQQSQTSRQGPGLRAAHRQGLPNLAETMPWMHPPPQLFGYPATPAASSPLTSPPAPVDSFPATFQSQHQHSHPHPYLNPQPRGHLHSRHQHPHYHPGIGGLPLPHPGFQGAPGSDMLNGTVPQRQFSNSLPPISVAPPTSHQALASLAEATDQAYRTTNPLAVSGTAGAAFADGPFPAPPAVVYTPSDAMPMRGNIPAQAPPVSAPAPAPGPAPASAPVPTPAPSSAIHEYSADFNMGLYSNNHPAAMQFQSQMSAVGSTAPTAHRHRHAGPSRGSATENTHQQPSQQSPSSQAPRRSVRSRAHRHRAFVAPTEPDDDQEMRDYAAVRRMAVEQLGLPYSMLPPTEEFIMHQVQSARNEAKAQGTSKPATRTLQRVKIEELPESDRQCCICYNEFGVTTPEGIQEEPVRLPKCQHVFGDHCIKQWLTDSATCPYCRDKLHSEPKKGTTARTFINLMRMRGLVGSQMITPNASQTGARSSDTATAARQALNRGLLSERRAASEDADEPPRRRRPRHESPIAEQDQSSMGADFARQADPDPLNNIWAGREDVLRYFGEDGLPLTGLSSTTAAISRGPTGRGPGNQVHSSATATTLSPAAAQFYPATAGQTQRQAADFLADARSILLNEASFPNA